MIAVGEIADDAAEWSEAFADVDGWDLQHVRRAVWFANADKKFDPKTLGGQVRTFASVNVAEIRTWVEGLEVLDVARNRAPKALPQAGASLDPAAFVFAGCARS